MIKKIKEWWRALNHYEHCLIVVFFITMLVLLALAALKAAGAICFSC